MSVCASLHRAAVKPAPAALVVVMRSLVVIAGAFMRTGLPWQPEVTHP